MTGKCRRNPAKTKRNTKRTIIVQFRVTPKQWKQLLRRADGKGKLSTYIRRKLGMKD